MTITVAQAGEHALIARLRGRLPASRPDVVVGIGDDAAVVEPPRGQQQALTTDTLVEGVHFDLRFCRPADVGDKALAVNLSDLAAMGAQPRVALLSLGLPDSLSLAAFDEFVDAFAAAAARERVTVVGGNLTRSPGPWFVDVTAIGAVGRRRVLTRDGGRPGDELYVTGALGAARAGLSWLMQIAEPGASPAPGSALADAVRRYRRPDARVRTGVLVGRNRAASCCMDLSDGLADAVTQVAESSATGAEIELAAVPSHPAVAERWPEDAAWQALLGGDDYELLFAVPPRRRRAFLAAVAHGRQVPITRIGRLTSATDGLRVRRPDGRVEPLPRGYEHFA